MIKMEIILIVFRECPLQYIELEGSLPTVDQYRYHQGISKSIGVVLAPGRSSIQRDCICPVNYYFFRKRLSGNQPAGAELHGG